MERVARWGGDGKLELRTELRGSSYSSRVGVGVPSRQSPDFRSSTESRPIDL